MARTAVTASIVLAICCAVGWMAPTRTPLSPSPGQLYDVAVAGQSATFDLSFDADDRYLLVVSNLARDPQSQRVTLRAEARDDEAANNLRDVVRGFLALGKMQAGGRPEIQMMMQSLELSGTGKTVALSFSVPAEVFDIIANAAKAKRQQ